MRYRFFAVTALATVWGVRPAVAQKAVTTELGVFGQWTKIDKELQLDNVLSGGVRGALYFFNNFGVEGDIQYGKTNWHDLQGTKSVTYRPYAFRLTYGLPVTEKVRIIIGAGYQNNVYANRVRRGPGYVAGNEYEDAFTGLLGLKVCVNERTSLRFDVPVDYNPSPNFNGSTITLDGKSTNVGFRAGLSYAIRGRCYQAAPPPPPPPPPAPPAPAPAPAPAPPPPPPPPPNQPPVATITSPANGGSFAGPITFTGACRDPEQGDITSGGRWTSSRDGNIGSGGSFTRPLSPSSHTITLTCTDNQGLTGTATATIAVQELLVRLNWVYFDFDKSALTAAGRDTLDRIIQTLQSRTNVNVAVEGHTDPYGSDEYNQRLSERRAGTVVSYLTRGGVSSGRIASKGFGEQCLLLDDDHQHPQKSKAEHRVNRRVEIWSVGDQGVSSGCRPRQ